MFFVFFFWLVRGRIVAGLGANERGLSSYGMSEFCGEIVSGNREIILEKYEENAKRNEKLMWVWYSKKKCRGTLAPNNKREHDVH